MSGALQAKRPMRDLLSDLAIKANTQDLGPFEAYVALCMEMDRLGLVVENYCSSSITSGGYARDSSLNMGEAIAKNTSTAMTICDELFANGQLNPRTTIEAVTLGKIKQWGQSDYMTFWLSIMAGLSSRGSGAAQTIQGFRRNFEAMLRRSPEFNLEIYDSTQPAAIRTPHYFEHANLFASTAQQHETDPVRRLIRLIDPDTSLGSQAENIFARLMGTSVFRIAIAQTGIEPSAQSMLPGLLQDTRQLIRFGATVFDTVRRQQLVLVPQDA